MSNSGHPTVLVPRAAAPYYRRDAQSMFPTQQPASPSTSSKSILSKSSSVPGISTGELLWQCLSTPSSAQTSPAQTQTRTSPVQTSPVQTQTSPALSPAQTQTSPAEMSRASRQDTLLLQGTTLPGQRRWGKDSTVWQEGPWPRRMLGSAAWAPRWIVWGPKMATFVRTLENVLLSARARRAVEAFSVWQQCLSETNDFTLAMVPMPQAVSVVEAPCGDLDIPSSSQETKDDVSSMRFNETVADGKQVAVNGKQAGAGALAAKSDNNLSSPKRTRVSFAATLAEFALGDVSGKSDVGSIRQWIASAESVEIDAASTKGSDVASRESFASAARRPKRESCSSSRGSGLSDVSDPVEPISPKKIPSRHDAHRRMTRDELTLQKLKRKSMASLCGLVVENLSILASYVPSTALQLISLTRGAMPKPLCVEVNAVAAIIDLSGFTKMCAELWAGKTSEHEPSGPRRASQQQKGAGVLFRMASEGERQGKAMEHAKKVINEAFDLLIDSITEHGGDIVRIAGDAIIVTFQVERQAGGASNDDQTDPETEKLCAQHAARCACKCIDIARSGKIPMKVHAGLSFGPMRRFHVGGESTWQVVVAGAPLKEAGAALDASEKLEVLVSPAMWKLLEGDETFTGKPCDGSDFIRLEIAASAESALAQRRGLVLGVASSESVQAQSQEQVGIRNSPAPPNLIVPSRPAVSQKRFSIQPWNPEPTPTTRQGLLEGWSRESVNELKVIGRRALLRYVPDVVQQGTITGVAGALSEIRKLTCMFIEIGLDLMQEGPVASLTLLESVFQTIVHHAVDFCGTVKELTCDDKGLVCILGFGLKEGGGQGRSGNEIHSSAARACLAAHRIDQEMREIHTVPCYIGIASGMVFCATLGNMLRREFAMVSSAMNTAARLMGAVKKGKSTGMREEAMATRDSRQGPFDALAPPRATFTEAILCTEDVVKDAHLSSVLAFYALEPIPLKGYVDPVPIYIIGAVILKKKKLTRKGSSRSRSTTKESMNSGSSDKDEGGIVSIVIPDYFSPTHSLRTDDTDSDVPCDDARKATALTYEQYELIAPAFFINVIIPPEVPDYVWLRCSGGDPIRIASLAQLYSKVGEPPGCQNELPARARSAHFYDLLEIGSSVPPNLRQQLSHKVAELSPLNQVVLKIVAVLGGYGETAVIRHLLDNETMVSGQWNALCEAFRQQWKEDNASSDEGSWHSDGSEEDEESNTSDIEELDILAIVLRDLQKQRWLEVDGDLEWVHCKDFLLIDSLYSTLAFSHRDALHTSTADWMRLHRNSLDGRLRILPHLIHHLMMSHREDRASALLIWVQCFGNVTYIQDLVIALFQRYLPVEDTEDTHLAVYVRAMKALPAIPYLRGLAKALQQQRVGDKVLVAVQRIQDKVRNRMRSRRSSCASAISHQRSMSKSNSQMTVLLQEVEEEEAEANGTFIEGKLCNSTEACAEHVRHIHYLLQWVACAQLSVGQDMLTDLYQWHRRKFSLVAADATGAILSYAAGQGESKKVTCMHLMPDGFAVYAPQIAVEFKACPGMDALMSKLEEWTMYENMVCPHEEPTVSLKSFPSKVFCIALQSDGNVLEQSRTTILGAVTWEQRNVWMSMLQACQPKIIESELPF